MDCSLPGSSVHGICLSRTEKVDASVISKNETVFICYHFRGGWHPLCVCVCVCVCVCGEKEREKETVYSSSNS